MILKNFLKITSLSLSKIENKNFVISFQIIRLFHYPIKKKIEMYCFIYLFINQDIISKNNYMKIINNNSGVFCILII